MILDPRYVPNVVRPSGTKVKTTSVHHCTPICAECFRPRLLVMPLQGRIVFCQDCGVREIEVLQQVHHAFPESALDLELVVDPSGDPAKQHGTVGATFSLLCP